MRPVVAAAADRYFLNPHATTHMKTRLHSHTLAVAAALGLGLPSANAQNPNLAPAAAAPAAAGAESPVPAEKRFDIELASGAVAEEVVTRLTQLAGRPLNVVWSGNSAATELPALRLHQVTLQEFFAAISAVGRLEQEQGRPGYRFSEVPNAENIYTFAILPPSNQMIVGGILAPTAAAAPKTSRFFDLSTLLTDTLTIDDITTAIRTAWTAAAGGDEPPAEALKYHQETQLLIATGQQKHLETVESIVELLQQRSRPSQGEKDAQIAQLKSAMESALLERDRTAQRLNHLEEESDAKLRELKTKIAELEIELAKASKNP